jgi:Uma2 family endonuclease
MSTVPRQLLEVKYARAAREYLYSLPLEHFMEAVPQATQRKVTLSSFDLVHARRPDVQVFNELLLQYRLGKKPKIHQVVPDNTVVVHPEPIQAETSYDIELQPVGPLMVLEYVSKNSERKDYDESLRKYERELKVPYYLVFYTDDQYLCLFHLRRSKYVSTKPNAQGRLPVAQLDVEVAMLDGWVRFWYKGELLRLPSELCSDLQEARRQLAEVRRPTNEQARRADEEARRADQQAHRADQLQQEFEQERQARQAAERELAQLRARLSKRPKNGRS